jgi:hypothetical protein
VRVVRFDCGTLVTAMSQVSRNTGELLSSIYSFLLLFDGVVASGLQAHSDKGE